MARPREFDRDEALDQAVQVFWRQGFEATTMTDLREAMGIGRQSLYDTFGDKHQLFDEALTRYLALNNARLAETLGDNAGLDAIRAFLHDAAHNLSMQQPRRGCLIMNTCAERAPHDVRAAALTEQGLTSTRTAFARVLRGAADRGEISPSTEVETIAAFLTSQMAGLSVLAQAGASENELIAIADAAMAAIAGPGRRGGGMPGRSGERASP